MLVKILIDVFYIDVVSDSIVLKHVIKKETLHEGLRVIISRTAPYEVFLASVDHFLRRVKTTMVVVLF